MNTSSLRRRLDKVQSCLSAPDDRPDLSLFTAEQLDESLYQLRLDKALSEGDTAEAEKLRMRHSVTVDELTDAFSNIDTSRLPPVGDWIPIQEGDTTYNLSQTEYRHIRTCIAIRGARAYTDDMWRWVEYFNV
jgi:hypothetical protein